MIDVRTVAEMNTLPAWTDQLFIYAPFFGCSGLGHGPAYIVIRGRSNEHCQVGFRV